MRKEDLYEIVKNFVKTRKEDPYAYFTASLRMRKFKISLVKIRSNFTKTVLSVSFQVPSPSFQSGGIYGISKMRILEGHRIVALTIVRATI